MPIRGVEMAASSVRSRSSTPQSAIGCCDFPGLAEQPTGAIRRIWRGLPDPFKDFRGGNGGCDQAARSGWICIFHAKQLAQAQGPRPR